MRFSKTLFAAALIPALAVFTAAAEDPSYPLTCTPGGAMTARVNHETDAASRIFSTVLTLNFAISPQGAGAATPPAGTCAWIDRPVDTRDATTLFLRADGAGADLRYEGGVFKFLGAVGAEPGRTALDFVLQAMQDGRSFTVMARNTRTGVLEITGIAP